MTTKRGDCAGQMQPLSKALERQFAAFVHPSTASVKSLTERQRGKPW
jgi:hypothetical protein